jgi:hypothetical protein
MKYFVWELCRFTWALVNQRAAAERGKEPSDMPTWLLRLLLLHQQCGPNGWHGYCDTGIDEAVYGKNQNFRIMGSSKVASQLMSPVSEVGVLMIYPHTCS